MTITLASIRNCLDGAAPSTIATCALDGTPNIAYLSQVLYIDNLHVALSFQFFNKTKENILVNPRATAQVVDPDTTAHYHLALKYLRTEIDGPLFNKMKAKLDAIASHTGMGKIFKLIGSDIYEVLSINKVLRAELPRPLSRINHLAALRAATAGIAECTNISCLLDKVLLCLEQHFDIHHSMLLLLNEYGDRLYTVASHGYEQSGIGSEIRLGEGIIGIAARDRSTIRITHMINELISSRIARETVAHCDLETDIPLPGISQSRSQLAVPILLHGKLRGILYVESPQDHRYSFEDEDALVTLADHIALSLRMYSEGVSDQIEQKVTQQPDTVSGKIAIIRHYAADHSIFIEGEYLIKGVAGAILCKLLHEQLTEGRIEFTNRELRLDPALRLPDITENLEVRLILLQKRLAERCPFIGLEKIGRGRFRLRITRPLQLVEST